MAKNKNKSASKPASNKTAPKLPAQTKPSTQATKEESAEIELDADDSDDEDEGDEGDEGDDKGEKKSHKVRFLARLNRMRPQIANHMAFSANNARMHAAAGKMMAALKEMLDEAEKLPENWKRAPGAKKQGRAFNAGDIVKLADGHRSKYKGLIEDDSMDELCVIKQIDKKVAVRTADGEKMFLPSHHLVSPKAAA